MSKRKIYIAGKVTGTPIHTCNLKFAMAKKEWEAKGYEVINPLEVVGDFTAKWIPAMKKCLIAMLGCEEIYFLSDWKKSKGAKVEHALSYILKYKRYHQTERK